MTSKRPLSQEGQRIKCLAKANHFAAFYRDVKRAFRHPKLARDGMVSVTRSAPYIIHRDTDFAFIGTPPAIVPGKRRVLFVKLKVLYARVK